MLVILKPNIEPEIEQDFLGKIRAMKLESFEYDLPDRRAIYVRHDIPRNDLYILTHHEAVDNVVRLSGQQKQVSADQPPVSIRIGDETISRETFTVMAGPCTFIDEDDLSSVAEKLAESGIKFLRAGVFKLRTSPYSYPGPGNKGLEILRSVAEKFGMHSITEVTSIEDAKLSAQYVDILQVGTRNMYNVPMLTTLGKIGKPVLLKRGLSSTYEEWLYAAEHIAVQGCTDIVLCERGIRTYDTHLRNTPDIAAIPVMKSMSRLPVIFDPSHATGKREMIRPLSLAACAAGADGLLVEVHPDPNRSPIDAHQTIGIESLNEIIRDIETIRKVYRNID